MNTSLRMFKAPLKQNGAVLIVALMILVILTLLGISAMRFTILETRMTANMAESNRAFQVAEIGVMVPRSYSVATISSLSAGTLQTDTRQIPGNKTTISQVTFTSRRVEGGPYADSSGRFGERSASVMYFITNSTGLSDSTNPDSAQTVLRGGLAQLVPKNNSTLNF
ncbi:MAG: PilX N-terminal domain-containing pilus assembly protein [Thiotrichaceae bacterium]|nr:PilX N-terminal domain-containing pilus assembly protein [Thiotrichaceae bacterium]